VSNFVAIVNQKEWLYSIMILTEIQNEAPGQTKMYLQMTWRHTNEAN